MNFSENFRRVGSVNTEAVESMLNKLSDASWEQPAVDLQRIDLYDGASMVSLAYDFDFRHLHPTRHAALEVFGQIIRPILGVTADFFDLSERGRELGEKYGVGYFVRSSFLALPPASLIAAHVDRSFSEVHSHRVHVPVITNAQAIISVQNESLHIPTGEVYEINNSRPYALSNAGDERMIHLVLDYVRKGEQCCCAQARGEEKQCSKEVCLATDSGQLPCRCYSELS